MVRANGEVMVGYVNSSNDAMILKWNGASSYGSIQTFSSSFLALNPSGNTVIIGSTSDTGAGLFEIKAPSDKYGMRIYSPNATNNCNGLWVDAGSSSADNALLIRNQSGSTNYYVVRGDGNIRMNNTVFSNTTSGTTRTLFIGNGDFFIGGISSIRTSKDNIQNIENVNWIYQLNPVTFNYRKKDDEGNYTNETFSESNYGLIAEDTQPIADFLINYNDKEDGSKEMVGIEYSRLITPMLKAIQEQQAQIEELKQIVATK
jgi:hypothetical protein